MSAIPNEFDAKIIQDFAKAIVGKLAEAAAVARVADGYGDQGFADRALETLLESEPLLHDALTLLNASSIVRRREQMRSNMLD